MRRSTAIQITLVAAMAASLGACESGRAPAVRHCVDDQGNVVDDDNCVPAPGMVSHTAFPRYRYWYGGYTPVGGHVSGGSYTPPSSGAHGTVTRGGFGTRGAAHVGGEGA